MIHKVASGTNGKTPSKSAFPQKELRRYGP
jgi:hypothetical protein